MRTLSKLSFFAVEEHYTYIRESCCNQSMVSCPHDHDPPSDASIVHSHCPVPPQGSIMSCHLDLVLGSFCVEFACSPHVCVGFSASTSVSTNSPKSCILDLLDCRFEWFFDCVCWLAIHLYCFSC